MLKNFTIGKAVVAAIGLALFYAILYDVDFVHRESIIGKAGSMLSAFFVWVSLLYFIGKELLPPLYEVVSKILN